VAAARATTSRRRPSAGVGRHAHRSGGPGSPLLERAGPSATAPAAPETVTERPISPRRCELGLRPASSSATTSSPAVPRSWRRHRAVGPSTGPAPRPAGTRRAGRARPPRGRRRSARRECPTTTSGTMPCARTRAASATWVATGPLRPAGPFHSSAAPSPVPSMNLAARAVELGSSSAPTSSKAAANTGEDCSSARPMAEALGALPGEQQRGRPDPAYGDQVRVLPRLRRRAGRGSRLGVGGDHHRRGDRARRGWCQRKTLDPLDRAGESANPSRRAAALSRHPAAVRPANGHGSGPSGSSTGRSIRRRLLEQDMGLRR